MEITLLAQDPDGDPLVFELFEQPGHGKLLGIPPKLTYWPSPDFAGAERFSFRVCDPHGAFDIGVVQIRISPAFTSLRIIPEVPETTGLVTDLVKFLLSQGVQTWYVLDVEPRVFAPGFLSFVFAGREARLWVVGPEGKIETREVCFRSGYAVLDFSKAQPGTYLLLFVSGTEAFSYPVRIVQPAPDRKLAFGG